MTREPPIDDKPTWAWSLMPAFSATSRRIFGMKTWKLCPAEKTRWPCSIAGAVLASSAPLRTEMNSPIAATAKQALTVRLWRKANIGLAPVDKSYHGWLGLSLRSPGEACRGFEDSARPH